MSISEEREIRKRTAIKHYEDGVRVDVIAEMLNVSVNTVNDYIRQGRHEEVGTGDHTDEARSRTASRKDMHKWALGMTGKKVRSEHGPITIREVYPNIAFCDRETDKGIRHETYTLSELFYLNGGRYENSRGCDYAK